MKIGTTNVKISALAIAVFGVFTLILIASYLITGDRTLLIWGIPTLILLLIFPMALNYMSQREYQQLAPVYEAQAKPVRIKAVNENMIGQIVRFEGLVERAYFQFLNRPQYLVADRSGEISVKMFTTPQEDIHKDDVVEVLGMVIKRYIVTGDPVINCVVIRKIDKKLEIPKKEAGKK